MKQLLVKLLFSVFLLVALVQALDYSKLTPEQKKQLARAALGGIGKTKGIVASCTKTSCGSGYVCTGGSWGCAIPEGSKCIPARDRCEGRYYCSGSGICNGSGRGELGAACKGTLDCESGFYCDLRELKCLELEDESMCFSNSDCLYKCSSNDCVCSGTKCVNR